MTGAYPVALDGGVALMERGTDRPICRWPDAAACETLTQAMREGAWRRHIEWEGAIYQLSDEAWQELYDRASEAARGA